MSATSEPRAHRIKRLTMRSMRRGIKEMDLILQSYAAARLAEMDEAAMALYDALLNENDQDLYRWVTGQEAAPPRYAVLIADIGAQYAPPRGRGGMG